LLGHQTLLQWRWDHERDAVLAEDAAAELAKKRAAEAAQAAHVPATLPALRREKHFADWRPDQPRELIAASRAIVYAAIDELRVLPSSRRASHAKKALAKAARAFNRLEAKHHFIYTIEREDIDAALFAIAEACGLDEATYEKATVARDW
jgi:hypothetical protein